MSVLFPPFPFVFEESAVPSPISTARCRVTNFLRSCFGGSHTQTPLKLEIHGLALLWRAREPIVLIRGCQRRRFSP